MLAALRTLVRRHRRIVAACLAGVGALIMVTALAPDRSQPEQTSVDASLRIPPGAVLVPVSLAPAGVLQVLRRGDVIDLVSSAPDRPARVIAAAARVVELPDSGSAFTTSSAVAIVTLAADDALLVAAEEELGVVIRERAAAH